MKAIQVTSIICIAIAIIGLIFSKSDDLSADLFSGIMLFSFTLIYSSHFVGLEKETKHEERNQ